MSYSGKFKDKNNNLHPVTSVLYGTCDTAAGTAAKVVTCADFDTLMTGVTIRVKFDNANTAASPTVNINSTGAKSVYRFGSTAPVDGDSWKAGEVVDLLYDGTSFFMVGADDIGSKQDALTFDDTPTDGSNNPVKSNGIYDSEKDIYAAMGEMGAKNLIPYPYNQTTRTSSGVTFTDNGDGSITISTETTASDNAFFSCGNATKSAMGIYLKAGTKIKISKTNKSDIKVQVRNSENSTVATASQDDVEYTVESSGYYYIAIRVDKNANYTTPYTLYPMLRLASDTDNTYQPYAKTNKQLTDDVALLDSEKADTDMVAADFNAGTSYTAGNYCVQDGKLYKFKNNHSGAWSAADVDEVKITGELSALKSGLNNLGSITTPTVGTNITLLNGGYTVIGNMVCVNISISTADVIPINNLIATLVPPAIGDTPISIYNLNTFDIVSKGRVYINGNVVASGSLDANAIYIIVGCYIMAN